MNKNLFRVIFNRNRGLRAVVQETARSAGKSVSVSNSSSSTGAIALVMLAVLTPTAKVMAQVVGASNVPGTLRPIVLMAPNGVPLVQIQTPSAAGVSRNIFSQFDVQNRGVILGNNRTNAQTQLGGGIGPNPFLASGPARIILAEVNSGVASQLRGPIEIGGTRAELVLANPAGISVDGTTFINASRATLTTGSPQLNAIGGLDSYVVRGGTISIDGAGFDARGSEAAILARATRVNAGIWADRLTVVTGANRVSADQSQITQVAGSGAAPSFALDVAHLGGMYAGHSRGC